jgi:hypothetical protein
MRGGITGPPPSNRIIAKTPAQLQRLFKIIGLGLEIANLAVTSAVCVRN